MATSGHQLEGTTGLNNACSTAAKVVTGDPWHLCEHLSAEKLSWTSSGLQGNAALPAAEPVLKSSSGTGIHWFMLVCVSNSPAAKREAATGSRGAVSTLHHAFFVRK